MDFCHECRLPLDERREVIHRIAGYDMCEICHSMFDALSSKKFFVDAQAEGQAKRKRLERLRSDGDYFEGRG